MSRILLHVKICRDVDVPLSLIRKLELFTKLSASDRDALSRIATDRVRHYAPREDLVREGEPPDAMYIMLDGWACRYKFLEDGRRQIVAFFLPGDVCDFNVFILKEMDHSIAAINQVRVGEVARDSFQDMIDLHPRVTQAFWWETLVNASIQREWTVNLGQRDAIERMAHLLCEVFLRLRGAGRTRGNACEFPITQADLADATGLSTVHVNRTLQELRAANLIVLNNRTLEILDLSKLQELALFSANYLHFSRDGAHLDAND